MNGNTSASSSLGLISRDCDLRCLVKALDGKVIHSFWHNFCGHSKIDWATDIWKLSYTTIWWKSGPKSHFFKFLIKTTLFLLNDGLRTPTNWKSYHHKPHHNECFFQLARLKNFDNRREKIFPKQYFSSDSDSQLVLSQTNIGNFLAKWFFP